MPDRPTRTLAAILFADIAGFTTLMQRDEGETLRVQERFFATLRQVHGSHDGRIVKHLGDGSLSIFSSAVNAVQCAVDLQRSFRQAPAIPVRIGLHLGDVIDQGDDIVGDGVNLAARLEALAVPGSVLLSGAIHQQVFNQPQFSFRELGAFFLKNVAQPVAVFTLDHEDLYVPSKAELTGATAPKHDNLPPALTSFLGREREVEEVKAFLLESRLVTLTGPGGTGKTRLALRVAEDLRDTFRDGLCWVNLAPVSDPKQVPFAIVQALEINQEATREIEEILLHYMENRALLLLLDNFEQILDAAPLMEQILRQCPQVKILVTSRVPLDLLGEQEYPLAPLPLPDPAMTATLIDLETVPSIALFAQRAQAVRPDFRLDAGNVEIVGQICIRLDGLPLAIELAAARIKVFPPKTLLERLSRSLDVLKTAQRNRPARHQTLRQTIAWSYELLEPEERQLFQRLSVFVGGGPLEAVEAICGQNGLAGWDVIDGLLALVNKSLVRLEERAETPRYYMLGTIREFAGEALERSSQSVGLREAHAAYFLEFAERAQPHLTGPEQRHWSAVLEEEQPNLKTAIQWSKRSGKEDWACRISIALLRFWLNKNLLLEAKQTQEDLLSIALPDRYPMLRLKLLQGLGTIYLNITNYRKAVLIFQEILDTWTRLGKPEEIAVNQNNLGWALLASGEGEKGEGLTLKALKYFEETGNLRGQCLSYTNLGALHLFSFGHPKKAITFFERSLALREQMGDERGVAFIKGYLGICYFKTGESDKGKKLLEESIAISRSRNDLYLVDFSLVWLAEQAFDYWDQQALIPLIKEIEDNNRAIGAPYGFSGYLYFFKGMSEAGRDTGKGEVWIEKGLQITEEYSIFVPVLLGRQIRGFILLKDRDYEKALETFQESLQMCHHHGNAIWMADALELIGVLLTEKGLWKTAACLLGKAKAVREDLETPVPPRNRPYISRTMALLEEKLGSQGFQATLEKSRQLDLEEAVSLATHREGRKKQP